MEKQKKERENIEKKKKQGRIEENKRKMESVRKEKEKQLEKENSSRKDVDEDTTKKVRKERDKIILEDDTIKVVRGKGNNESVKVSSQKHKPTTLKKIIDKERNFYHKETLPSSLPLVSNNERVPLPGDQLKRT